MSRQESSSMSAIARRLGIRVKKDSPLERLLVASRGAIVLPDQGHPQMNITNGSIERPRSLYEESILSSLVSGVTYVGSKAPSYLSYADSYAASQLTYVESNEYSCTMEMATSSYDRVQDLTGRVSVSSNVPVATNSYSSIWTGKLDNSHLVAIRGLKGQHIRPAKTQRRIRREIGKWHNLRHENVIPLLGLVYDEKTFGCSGAIVSPWYTNGSATSYLSNKEKPVSMTGRIDLFYGVANGLHYLHTFDTTKFTGEPASGSEQESRVCVTGIVHGDLKPPNVLVDDNGVAKLCDFGLLTLIRKGTPTGVTITTAHTGTTRYLCYELVAEDENLEVEVVPTTASDVHALASVGLEKAIENKVPPAVRPEGISGVESTLWDLFEECWSIDPKDRPDARAVCDYLRKNQDDLVAAMQGYDGIREPNSIFGYY